MYKSLPIRLLLANEEKPQLLILAMEHLAHSLFGSRDEVVSAKERSFSPVGRNMFNQTDGRRGKPASVSLPPPALLSNRQPESLSFLKHRPLFPPKHSRPEELERKQKTCLPVQRAGEYIFQKDNSRKTSL